MQVSVENTGDLGRRLNVAVPAEQIDGKVAQRIRELGGTAKLKGFRPGKVPFKVLEQRFGAQVREDVVKDVLRESFQSAVTQEDLRPAGTPEITVQSHKHGEDLQYTAQLEVYPQVESVEVAGMAIERPAAEVGGGDVDQMIETLRQQRREWQQVERGAQHDDLVMTEFDVQADTQRHPREGRQRAGTVLGSGSLLPGVEERLEGMSKGEEGSVELTLPDDFANEEMRGSSAQVTFKVLSVAESKLPDLDDEFVQSFGVESGDLEEFKGEVRANLEREMRQAVLSRLRQQVVDNLLATYADLQLPEALITEEAANLARQAQEPGEESEVNASGYQEQARKRVASGFLLAEVARQNDIEVDVARVRERIAEIASTYEDPMEVIQVYQKNPQLMDVVKGSVLEEQVLDWIVEHASVTDVPSNFDALLRSGSDSEVKT